jgi:biopolymer transport protein ExbD
MAVDREERLAFIAALEESVKRKIEELTVMQADKTMKYQHMQGVKDSIYRQKRQIAAIREELKLKS